MQIHKPEQDKFIFIRLSDKIEIITRDSTKKLTKVR